jgi:biopolymer transport protein TolR
MQINGGPADSGLQSEINITPLVDVVLVLLIIFMVVVPLLLQGYAVESPRVSAEAAPRPVEETQLILSIRPEGCPILDPPERDGLPADCRVSLAQREIPAAELPARLAEAMGGRPSEQRVLFLAADDSLNYEGVLRVMDLARSGVDDLMIEVISAE